MTKNAQGMIQGIPVLSQTNLSGGTLGTVTSIIGMLYTNPPVRTADYIASVEQGLGIAKVTRAQEVTGSGADVLSPIIRLWQVSRNISYVLLIIIFLIIGLMVMFRNKLNPQTVITAQTALPGLVIGLIMITFSYFFAGLISDFAFVSTNMVGYYFSAARGATDAPQDLVKDISKQSTLSIVAPFTRIATSSNVSDFIGSIWNDLAAPQTQRQNPFDLDPQKLITDLAMFMVTQLVLPFGGLAGGSGQIISAAVTLPLVGLFPVQVVGLALSMIAMIILIMAMFRLMLRLINNFITIIFLTIIAPFQFLAAALPGRQSLATDWMLNMLANILAFPAVIAVLYFVAFLLGPQLTDYCARPCPFKVSQVIQRPDNYLVSPVYADSLTITGNAYFPMFGGMNIKFINLLLAFGAIVALPAVPDIIGRAIGKLGTAGQLIGQEISSSTGSGRRYAGQFNQTGGFAERVGRMNDKPGYFGKFNDDTKQLEWNQSWEPVHGAQMGTWNRLKTGLNSYIPARFRKPKV